MHEHQFLRRLRDAGIGEQPRARPDSPEPYSACVMVTWPTALPISIATMTSSSQPAMAAIRCRALQPPSEAARLDLCAMGRPAFP